jgi:outer membrane protein W
MNSVQRTVAIAVLTAASPLAFAAEHEGWTLRFHGAIVESSAENRSTVRATGVASEVDVGASGGFGLAAEYRLFRRFGVELSALFAPLELDKRSSTVGAGLEVRLELSMMPLTFGVPFHLRPAAKTDLYIGPAISHVSYLDAASAGGEGRRPRRST